MYLDSMSNCFESAPLDLLKKMDLKNRKKLRPPPQKTMYDANQKKNFWTSKKNNNKSKTKDLEPPFAIYFGPPSKRRSLYGKKKNK